MHLLFDSGLMYGFTRLFLSWFKFTDCLMFGAIISATDPGKELLLLYTYDGTTLMDIFQIFLNYL